MPLTINISIIPHLFMEVVLDTRNTLLELLDHTKNNDPDKFPAGMTELELIQFIMSVENKFKVDINDEHIEGIQNLDDLEKLLDNSPNASRIKKAA